MGVLRSTSHVVSLHNKILCFDVEDVWTAEQCFFLLKFNPLKNRSITNSYMMLKKKVTSILFKKKVG